MTTDRLNQSDTFTDLQKFGKFQLVQYFLICLPLTMVSVLHVNYIFVAEDDNHRCKVPECETSNPTVDIPEWWPKGANPKCSRPVLDNTKYVMANKTCSNTTFVGKFEDCHEWIFENNYSIVSALNLGCQSWKATLVGSIHNAGMFVSMSITGWIADRVGRKPAIIACAIGGVVGVIKAFLTNYYLYLAIEFLESVLASGLYTVAVVLLIEVGGETKRVMTGVLFSYALYVGEVLFAALAMWLKYWKTLIYVIYTPLLLFITYIFLLKESVRWQMIRGKTDGAKQTLKFVAKFNKLNINPQEIDDLTNEGLRCKYNVVIQKENESVKDIVNSKEMMIRLVTTSYCFFTSSFIYYSLMVHSVLLPGNKYMNFVLAGLASFPGDLLSYYAFNKFGRKISLQGGYLFSALCLVVQTYLPSSIKWLKILLFLLGKLGTCVCFTGIYTYSLEVFPTSVRGTMVGFCNTVARVGSMLAPLTLLLISQMESLPSILFASTAVIAALVLILMPETKTLPLFDTIAQIASYKLKTTTHL